jgi:peptidyl-prolyl cis-trans isomerase C
LSIRRTSVYAIIFYAGLCLAAFSQEPKPATPPSPQATKDEDVVVAKVSGENITEKQVLTVIDQLARQKQMPSDQNKNKVLFQDAVDNLVVEAMLKTEVKQQNVVVDKTKVDQQFLELTKRFPTPEKFQEAMKGQGLTEASLRKSIEDNLSYQQVVDQATKDVPAVSDADVKKFYDEHPEPFAVPDQVHAAHILLRVEQNTTPEQKAEIKKKLEAIRADIDSKKITFADAAAKNSQDPSNAQKGGDLGFFGRGNMVKPFEDAAFATKPGELSGIVETQFGYHIIQVIEFKPAHQRTLDEVKAQIKQYLEQGAKQTATQKYLGDLKSKAKVEMFMTVEDFGKRHPQK